MAKRLKSFVRVTRDGVVVQGSNILARKRPSVGRWIEIANSVCCITTTTTTTEYVPEGVLVTSNGDFVVSLDGNYITA